MGIEPATSGLADVYGDQCTTDAAKASSNSDFVQRARRGCYSVHSVLPDFANEHHRHIQHCI
ncbi:hypothetical protein ACTXT7_013892 [Hymenolepis weldensis]